MKKLLTILVLLISANMYLIGQEGVLVKGKVLESSSGQVIEYATVLLKDKETKEMLTGATTNLDGIFEVRTKAQNFLVEINFLGYEPKVVNDIDIVGRVVDLGVIQLGANSEVLDEVTVVAEKSQTVFKLDKRVFNVGKDLSSAGGSALDVLNNVPSVDVNIEGAVSLRGNSNVQILINGKPTVMTSGNALGTITADMIESVEVITNPSAKYDAEGTTGILNIILKKEEKKGLNGSVTLNTGVPNNHSVGLSLNRRTEKFNLFAQLGAGLRRFESVYSGERTDKSVALGNSLINTGTGEKNEQFYNIRLGTDYHINPLNVITLSGYYAYEFEKEYADIDYDFLSGTGALESESNRDEETTATNPKWEYELQYTKTFKDNEDHQLSLMGKGSSFGKDKSSDFVNTDSNFPGEDLLQKTINDFVEREYIFQGDYKHPLNKTMIWELGGKYETTDITNDYKVEDMQDNEWIVNSNFTNTFDFTQAVLGGYTTFSYEKDKWGAIAGVRVENTDFTTYLHQGEQRDAQNYTDLFPSVHTSYKFTEGLSMQLGYSRRIHRPRMWDLNPFTSFRDNLNLSTGNPNLLPSYTNAYEWTTIFIYKKVSLNGAVFYRHSTDVVNDVVTIEDNIRYTRPENVGESQSTGIEINGRTHLTKWLSLSADFNWQYFRRFGEYEATSFDFNNDSWSSKLQAKLKLPKDIDMQVSGRYRSSIEELFQTVKANYVVDFGVRKKILKGRGIINFSVRDVFNTRAYITEVDQPDYYVYDKRRRVRTMVLGFSYGFGKGEAMEFSGHKRF